MATTNELISNINNQVQRINNTSGSNLPQLTPLKPITPGQLNAEAQPAQPVPSPVQTNNFQEQLAQPQQASFAREQQQNTENYGTAAATSFEDYITATLETPGFEQVTAEQYAKQGVDKLQAKVNEYDLQIMAEQKNLRRRIEEIQTKGGGLKMGANAEIQNATRESIATQADLGMLRAFAFNDYQAAKTTADRAVNAITEQNDKYVAALKENYNRYQDLFTTAQQREFQVRLADYERQQEFEISQFETLQNTKLNAMQMLKLNGVNDPGLEEQIGAAKSVYDVVRLAGQAGVTDLMQREQLRASIANSWSSAALNDLKYQAEKKAQQRVEDAINSGEVVLDSEQRDTAMKISKEYETESSEFKKQVGAYNRIIASAQDPSAAGDLALIFNYMKMLDPGSTVREGEFANAQNSAGVPQRIISQYNSVISGERLSEATRNDFVDRSDLIYETSLEQQMALEDRYRDKAINLFGLPENAADLVVQDIRAVGSYSETAFGIKFDNMSTDQLQYLNDRGLLGNTSTPAYGTQ